MSDDELEKPLFISTVKRMAENPIGKRVVIVVADNASPPSWSVEWWRQYGARISSINHDYGKFAGYDPDFVALDEVKEWPTFENFGRMQVSGKLTAYFEERTLLRSLYPDRRRTKRNERKFWLATHRRMEWQRKAKGYRRFLRRQKAAMSLRQKQSGRLV